MKNRTFDDSNLYPRNTNWVGKFEGEVERYDYPDTSIYRFVCRYPDDSGAVVYFPYEDMKRLFNQLLPEFMVKDEADDSYIPEEDVEYTLTPKGRAIADGMQLRSVEVKTVQYEDGAKMTESREYYSHDDH